MPKSVRIIDGIGSWIVISALSVIPIFFLPLTQDFYDTNKWMLLVISGFSVVVLWLIKGAITRSLTISITPGSLGYAGLAIAAFVSLLLASPNKIEGILSPFGFGTFAGISILFLLGSTFLTKQRTSQLAWCLMGTTSIAGLIAVYQFFGLGKIIFPSVAFLRNPLWTPAGSNVGLVLVLIIMIPVMLGATIDAVRQKKDAVSGLGLVFVLTSVAGLGVILFSLIPKLSTTLLPLSVGWAVLLETLKVPIRAILGIGAENYLSAFTTGRTVSLNAGPFWNVRSVLAPSLALHIVTTLGLLGGLGLVLIGRSMLLLVIIRRADTSALRWGLRISLILGMLLVIFATPNLSFLVALSAVLLLSENTDQQKRWKLSENYIWIYASLVVAVFAGIGILGWFMGRAYAAEVYYYRSLLSQKDNKGTETYNWQILANQLNPSISRFHIGISQTSMSLADSIVASSANAKTGSPGAQLSEEDKQLVTQLVQQAIQEAKNGTNLAPKSVIAWENLAAIYESLLKVAQGSDQWTVAAYQQAIQLDPSNPILRLRLGGVYASLDRPDEALGQYGIAASLKPDYANAHYNIADVYRKQKKWLQAAAALTITKQYVLPGSDNSKQIDAELSEAKQHLNKEELDALDKQFSSGSDSGNFPSTLSPLPSTGGSLLPVSTPGAQTLPTAQ